MTGHFPFCENFDDFEVYPTNNDVSYIVLSYCH